MHNYGHIVVLVLQVRRNAFCCYMQVVLVCRNIGREYAYPGSTGQAFRQQLRTALSPDEKLAAERDLALYCKPVELYNIIQRRAVKNVKFILQLCSLLSTLYTWPCLLCSNRNHYVQLIWDTNDGSLNFAAPFYSKMPSLQYTREEEKEVWTLNGQSCI